MSRRPYSYDPECETLARYFLAGEPLPKMIEDEMAADEQVRSLAQAIQDAVEAWFEAQRGEPT